MEATSSTASDQGRTKQVHIFWGPALSFFYCMDLCLLKDGFTRQFLSQLLLHAKIFRDPTLEYPQLGENDIVHLYLDDPVVGLHSPWIMLVRTIC